MIRFYEKNSLRFPRKPVVWLRFKTTAIPTIEAPPIESSDGRPDDWPLKERQKLFEVVFAEECKRAIQIFVVAMNIARPGVLKLGGGICLMDDRPVLQTGPILHGIDVAFREATERGWPDFLELDPVDTWKWAIRQRGFLDGTSDTPIGRALTAYSNLFGEAFSNGEIEELVWSLIGLEALYTRNEGSVLNQIVENCALLVPGANEYKKKIKKLYGFRSRLLHGQKNIPNKFNADHATPEIERIRESHYATRLLGTAVLVASLQCLVHRKLDLLDFCRSATPST